MSKDFNLIENFYCSGKKLPNENVQLLQNWIENLRKATERNDVNGIMFLLCSEFHRRTIRNQKTKSRQDYYEIKRAINLYVKEIINHLYYLSNLTENELQTQNINQKERIAFFSNIQKSFGHSALLLSGGGSWGSYHIGVLRSLFKTNLLPNILCGSSSGSLVCALICVKTNNELEEFFQLPEKQQQKAYPAVLYEPGSNHEILCKFQRLLETEGYMGDDVIFANSIRQHLGGDITFEEAFRKTKRVLNISVSSSKAFESLRLLNYVTSPNVVIWSAVLASCTFPRLFRPQLLLEKKKDGVLIPWGTSGEVWSDGSQQGDIPKSKLSEIFNVTHFIVCQVNPHLLPFMHPSSPIKAFLNYFPRISYLLFLEFRHLLSNLSLLPGNIGKIMFMIQNVFNQPYSGDITIVPHIECNEYLHLMSNPTPEFVLRSTQIGERATWKYIETIKVHWEIEVVLERLHSKLSHLLDI